MKKIKRKKKRNKKKQIVEIHIYVHQDNLNTGFTPNTIPTFAPQFSPCPVCGRVGQHTCVTCGNNPTYIAN